MSSNAPSSSRPVNRGLSRVSPRRTVGLGVLAFTLILSACGSEQSLGGKVAKDGGGCAVTEVERDTSNPPKPEAGLKVGKKTTTTDVTQAGKGACPTDPTKYLALDLVGATAKDGKVFSNTFKDANPLTARLGQNQLLAGLETGLTGMKVGARRQIVIPAAEAYGKAGNPAQGIGPNQDLVFIADLISLTDAPVSCNKATNIPKGTRAGKPTEVKMPVTPPKKVTTTVLVPGTGPKATKKSYLTVDYLGVACSSGQQFDSSWDRDDPITIAMADAKPTAEAFSVIPGWTAGLLGQRQGSTVLINIPAKQAYGAQGQSSIGPNEPLTFIVKILKVSPKPPPPAATTTTAVPGATTTAPAGSTTTAPAASTTTAAGK